MNKPVSWFTLKKVSLLKRMGIYPTPQYIPVFFQHRSGSTVHGATLDTHPHCVSLNEAFEFYNGKHLELTYENFLKPIHEHRLYKRASKGKYLTHCFMQFNQHYFPIFNVPHDIDTMFSFVGKQFGSMVYIHRRNTLKKLVSTLRASQHQVWHEAKDTTNSKRDAKIYLDVNQQFETRKKKFVGLENYLNHVQLVEDNILNKAKQTIPNLLELVYENDIEPDVMIGVNKVIDFFNIPESRVPLTVPLAKTSRGLEHDIENFNEVSAYLKNTPFAWMIE